MGEKAAREVFNRNHGILFDLFSGNSPIPCGENLVKNSAIIRSLLEIPFDLL